MTALRSLLRRWFPYLEDSALFFLGMLVPIGATVLLCVMVATCARAAEQPKETHVKAQQIVTYGPWQGYWVQARLSAYSPHDALDREYHESKGERWRWITADGRTDVRSEPYGLAAPSSIRFGTRIFIPTGHGYLDSSRSTANERVFVVSDRGKYIERGSVATGGLWIDVRFRTEHSALAFGVKDAWVFIITSAN